MSKQTDSPADALAPHLRLEADLREFQRLFVKYYDSHFPQLVEAWDAARQASFVKRKVVTR